MTISELIEALEKIKEEYGDLDVMFDSPNTRFAGVEDIDYVKAEELFYESNFWIVRIGWSGIE